MEKHRFLGSAIGKSDKTLLIEIYIVGAFNVGSGELEETTRGYYVHGFRHGDEIPVGRLAAQKHTSGVGERAQEMKYRLVNVLMGDAAKEFLFDAEWAELEEFEQWLLETTIFELGALPKTSLKSPKKLLAVARGRLRKHDFMVPCSRCGGSGNYSYCQMYGTTCFKCGGQRFMIPARITKKWKKSVEEFDFKAAHEAEIKAKEEAPVK